MECVVQRAVTDYLQKMGTTPTVIRIGMPTALGEYAVPYDTVKIWYREFKCGSTSCEDKHGGRWSKIVNTEETINKIMLW